MPPSRFCPQCGQATGQEKGLEQFTEKGTLSSNGAGWRGGEVGRIDRQYRGHYHVRIAGVQNREALPAEEQHSPTTGAYYLMQSLNLQCVDIRRSSRNTADPHRLTGR